MRSIDSGLLAALDSDRQVDCRATIRDTLLRFTEVSLNDSAVDGATSYAADFYTSGSTYILRVAVVSDVIWAQHGTMASLGSWSSTGISVKSGSGVGLFGNKMWYQDTSGNMQERTWSGSSFGSATQRTPTGWSTALKSTFAGVHPTGVYYMQEEFNTDSSGHPIYHSQIGLWDGGTTYQHPGQHYDSTSSLGHFYAARGDNPLSEDIDFIAMATSDGGKAIYMTREGRNWGQIRDIMPLDVVDDTSKFIVGGLTTGGNRIWLTGRLVRSAGADLQVYGAVHRDGDLNYHFSLGREMFICEHTGTVDNIGMKLIYVDNYVWGLGLSNRWRSDPTVYYGTDASSKKLILTDGIEGFSMSCGHNRATQLNMTLDPAIDDPLIDIGNQLILRVAYDSNWSDFGVFIIDQVHRVRDESGQSLEIVCVDEVGWRLENWSNDADYDYWGPAKLNTYAKDMAYVLRGPGDWEEVDANGLKNIEQVPAASALNRPIGHCLSLERPSNNGMMMARFVPYVDSTGYMRQSYGVVTNFYNEQKWEALEREGDHSFGDWGVEAFAFLYGDTEAGGSKGFGLYKNMPANQVIDGYQMAWFQSLDTYAVDLGSGTDVWLLMIYTDAEIKCYYKKHAEPSNNWTQVFVHKYTYDDHYPYYDMRKRGRMGIFMQNPTHYFTAQPFKSDSLYIGVYGFSGEAAWADVPTSGELTVEGEILSYNGRDSSTNSGNSYNNVIKTNYFTFPEADGFQHDNPYTGPFTGYEIYFTSNDTGTQAHDYYNDMCMVVVDGPGKGNTYKITDYDYVAPKQWIPTGTYTYPDTWKDHVGEVGYGSWQTISGLRRIFVNEEPSAMLGDDSKFYIMHRLDIDQRGLYDSVDTSHDNQYLMVYRDTVPSVEEFISHGGEKDLTFEYVATDVARNAGVMDVTFDTIHDEGSLVSFSNSGWNLSGDHASYWEPQPDAVIEMYINTITGRIGIGLANETWSASDAYICLVDDTNIEVWDGTTNMLHRLAHNREMTQKTKVTFVVGGGFISVFISDAFMFAAPIDGSKEGIFLTAYNTASAYVRWSHLDIHIDNFIADMGSSGMASINRLIGEKHINFQHDENTLHFFKDRVEINNGNPWDMAVDGVDFDDASPMITRLRLEGVDNYEEVDAVNLKQYGNVFRVANSEEINEAEELKGEAAYIINDANSAIDRTMLTGGADPRVEPDDIYEVTFTNSNRTDTREIVVDNIEFRMGISPGEAIFDMNIEGRDA